MTTLYRIYGTVDQRDKAGFGAIGTRLLYVGITDNYAKRMRQHSEKRWWESVTKITREEFGDRSQAAAAERAAITTEKPIHNKAMNAMAPERTPIPKAQQDPRRCQRYSINEAADYLGVSTKTIRRRIADGILPAARIKGSRFIRIRQTDLDALLVPIPTVMGARS